MSVQQPSPIAHINKIFGSFNPYQIGRSGRALLQTLDTQIATVFAKKEKFITELLQNADDARATEFRLNLVGEYLVVSHNGREFSYEDVERLCDNASQAVQGKIIDRDTTGYKGIGFKSVFCITDYVCIVSGKEDAERYSFRFDKNVWGEGGFATMSAEVGRPKHPWQIIPVWTKDEDLPESVRGHLGTKVNFIFKFKDRKELEEILAAFFQDPAAILFLRNIRDVYYGESHFHMEGRQIESQEVKTVEINQGDRGVVKHFLFRGFDVDGEDFIDAISKLFRLDAYTCPQKLRNATKVTVTFLVEVILDEVEGLRVVVGDGGWFSYLPTNVTSGLPFYVNADFLLTADRGQLLINDWNKFLARKIVELQFAWLRELAKNPALCKQMFKLLGKGRIVGVPKEISDIYHDGFSRARGTERFIPAYADSDQGLLTISEAVIDRISFFSKFPEITIHSLPIVGKIVSYDLKEYYELLMKLHVANRGKFEFGFDGLIENLEVIAAAQEDADFNQRLLVFLRKFIDVHSPHVVSLQKKKVILTRKGELCAPQDIYLSRDGDEMTSSLYERLQYLHPDIGDHDGLYQWLRDVLGVRDVGDVEIVRGYVMSLIKSEEITPDLSQAIVKLLFKIYESPQKGQLSSEELIVLRRLPVLKVGGGWVNIQDSYLPLEFAQSDELPHGVSIWDVSGYRYISRDNLRFKRHWGKFAVWLGAQGGVKFEVPVEVKLSDLKKRKNISQLKGYISSLTKSEKDLLFSSFVYMADMDGLLEKESNRKLFWDRFVDQWKDIKNCNIVRWWFISGKSKRRGGKAPSYLCYYFGDLPNLMSKRDARKSYKAADLYWAEMDDVIGDVADVVSLPDGVSLNRDQAAFIGLRVDPDVIDLLLELDFLANNYLRIDAYNVVNKFRRIVRFLVNIDLDEATDETIRDWSRRSASKLLAADGSWQSITELRMLRETDDGSIKSSRLLYSVFDSEEDKKRFGERFGLREVTDDFMQVRFSGNQEDEAAKRSLIKHLPELVLFISKERSEMSFEQRKEILRTFFDAISRLMFLRCQNLTVGGASLRTYYSRKDQHFYYTGRWNSSANKSKFCHQLIAFLQIKRVLSSGDLQSILDLDSSKDPEDLSELLVYHGFSVDEDYAPIKDFLDQISEERKKTPEILESGRVKKVDAEEIKEEESAHSVKGSQIIGSLEGGIEVVDDEGSVNIFPEKSFDFSKYGLRKIEIPPDGHCLYHAVALYLGKDQSYLRERVAAYLEVPENREHFSDFIKLADEQSIDEYIVAVRAGGEWASHVEIEVLMRVLDRPIIIVDPKGKIINQKVEERFHGSPILVYFDDINHYDSLIVLPDFNIDVVLKKLQKENPVSPVLIEDERADVVKTDSLLPEQRKIVKPIAPKKIVASAGCGRRAALDSDLLEGGAKALKRPLSVAVPARPSPLSQVVKRERKYSGGYIRAYASSDVEGALTPQSAKSDKSAASTPRSRPSPSARAARRRLWSETTKIDDEQARAALIAIDDGSGIQVLTTKSAGLQGSVQKSRRVAPSVVEGLKQQGMYRDRPVRSGVDSKSSIEIGGRGEKVFFDVLQKTKIEDLLKFMGFKWLQKSIDGSKYEQLPWEKGFQWVDRTTRVPYIQIEWPGKKTWESEKKLASDPYDFIITFCSQERRIFVEVKTTTRKDNNLFQFSWSEFCEMQKEKDNYVLIIVDLKENGKGASIRKPIRNPYKAFIDGKIVMQVRKVELSLRPSAEESPLVNGRFFRIDPRTFARKTSKPKVGSIVGTKRADSTMRPE